MCVPSVCRHPRYSGISTIGLYPAMVLLLCVLCALCSVLCARTGRVLDQECDTDEIRLGAAGGPAKSRLRHLSRRYDAQEDETPTMVTRHLSCLFNTACGQGAAAMTSNGRTEKEVPNFLLQRASKWSADQKSDETRHDRRAGRHEMTLPRALLLLMGLHISLARLTSDLSSAGLHYVLITVPYLTAQETLSNAGTEG